MTRIDAYLGKTTDVLSALFLLLVLVLSGGIGPSLPQGAAVAASTTRAPVDAEPAGHRSTPLISKQQQLVSDAGDDLPSMGKGGKTKTLLPAGGWDLHRPLSGPGAAGYLVAVADSVLSSPFDARGPPAQS